MRTASIFVIMLLGVIIASAQPKLLKRVDPIYPEDAKKEGIEGIVYVEAKIDANGNVASAKVIKSTAKALDQAALDAAKGFTFDPSSLNGGKEGHTMVTIPFKFKLTADKTRK